MVGAVVDGVDAKPALSDFRRARGLFYVDFLQRVHDNMLFDLYFEVGTNIGNSLAPSRSRSVAVDPFFRIEGDLVGAKPGLHLFQCSSDEFFAGDFLGRNDMKIGFGFLDGMHLFEYLLRDLINAERHCREGSVLALHDCCPFGFRMLTRDLDNIPNGAWTGDVWKLVPILRQYRPDLTLTVLDCSPTGLCLLTGLDPENTVLSDNYEDIVAQWVDIELQDYGVAKLYEQFDYTDAQRFVDDGLPLFASAAMKDAKPFQPVKVST